MVKTKKIAMISLALVMAFALMFGVLAPMRTVQAYTYNGGVLGLWERMAEIDDPETKSGAMTENDRIALAPLIREYYTTYFEGQQLGIYMLFGDNYDYTAITASDLDGLEYGYVTIRQFIEEREFNYQETMIWAEFLSDKNSFSDIENASSAELEQLLSDFNQLYGDYGYESVEEMLDDWMWFNDDEGLEEDKENMNLFLIELVGSSPYSSNSGSNSGSGNSGSGAGAGVVTNTLVATLSVIVLGTAITLLSVKKRTNK